MAEKPTTKLRVVHITPKKASGRPISINKGCINHAKDKVAAPINDEKRIKLRSFTLTINDVFSTFIISLHPLFRFELFCGSLRVSAAGIAMAATMICPK